MSWHVYDRLLHFCSYFLSFYSQRLLYGSYQVTVVKTAGGVALNGTFINFRITIVNPSHETADSCINHQKKSTREIYAVIGCRTVDMPRLILTTPFPFLSGCVTRFSNEPIANICRLLRHSSHFKQTAVMSTKNKLRVSS